MKTAITVDFLRKLPAGPCDIWDAKCKGLVLRIRESGTATWVFVYGRSKKVTLGRADAIPPAAARELAHRVIGELADGKDPSVERRKRTAGTLRSFLTGDYAKWSATEHKTDNVSRITQVFDDTILGRQMNELTAFHFEQWRTKRRKAGIKEATINRDLGNVRAVLSKAIKWRLITVHPMRDVKHAKLDILGRTRFLSLEEEQRLRATMAARDAAGRDARDRFNAWRAERGYATVPSIERYIDHLTPMVLLALNCGLRRGDLLGLRWDAVDLVAARLTARGITGKTGLTRYVPLNAEAVDVLSTWRRQVSPADPAALVFPGPDGQRMKRITTAWNNLIDTAKIQDFTFHDLRHTFASRLVAAGVDLNTVRALLGHANITMTLRYAHLASDHLAAAVARLVPGGA